MIGIGSGPQQGASRYHVADERCFAAMARTAIAWAGRPLLTGPQGTYVYAFAPGAADIATAPILYAKAEAPGSLTMHRAGVPCAVQLVERARGEDRALETLPYSATAGGIAVAIAPTQQAYWVRVAW